MSASQKTKIKTLMMIDAIIEKFPFDKVQKFMQDSDWKWGGVGVPSVSHLQGTAMSLLSEATKCWSGDDKYFICVSSGGLEAVVWYGRLELRFIPYHQKEFSWL